MEQRFYSHGKLLITGEYLVVDGAQALAIPCKYGQDLIVVENESEEFSLEWNSLDVKGDVWFSSEFINRNVLTKSGSHKNIIEPTQHTDLFTALNLARLLSIAFELSGNAPKGQFKIVTHLEFSQDWGLGSSSTLIVNIAKWLKISPFDLFFKYAKGSGYDLACGNSKLPIVYALKDKKPIVHQVDWNPPFKEKLFFIHLGKKQKSDLEVKKYAYLKFDRVEAIRKMDELTNQFLNCADLIQFEGLINKHESLMSSVLNRNTIKEELFSDYKGAVKSLGAWGGDFIMVTEQPDFKNYFKSKGLHTILSFQDMIYAG